jgi:site-specific recombinase XerD
MFGKNTVPALGNSSLEAASCEGSIRDSKDASAPLSDPRVARFLLYVEAELHFSRESLEKYASVLRQLERQLGKPIADLQREDIYRIKARFIQEKLSDNWLASTVLVVKRYLQYIRDVEGVDTLDPAAIKPPKRRYREVVFLTTEEVERFVASIKLRNADGSFSTDALSRI